MSAKSNVVSIRERRRYSKCILDYKCTRCTMRVMARAIARMNYSDVFVIWDCMRCRSDGKNARAGRVNAPSEWVAQTEKERGCEWDSEFGCSARTTEIERCSTQIRNTCKRRTMSQHRHLVKGRRLWPTYDSFLTHSACSSHKHVHRGPHFNVLS